MAEPAETPVTRPLALTEAIVPAELLQVPPLAASVSVIDEPEQTEATPVMLPAAGAAFTVNACVAIAVPQVLVTV